MKYKFSTSLSLAAISLVTGLTLQVQAQTPPTTQPPVIIPQARKSINIQRARNLARQAAEKENGGLSVYTADPSMHGPVEWSPYVENSDGSWTFTFTGGEPGYAVPSVETAVTIFPDGTVQIDYNGEIRPSVEPSLE